jgi:drug/metabolite transporter (DMT)-like permease
MRLCSVVTTSFLFYSVSKTEAFTQTACFTPSRKLTCHDRRTGSGGFAVPLTAPLSLSVGSSSSCSVNVHRHLNHRVLYSSLQESTSNTTEISDAVKLVEQQSPLLETITTDELAVAVEPLSSDPDFALSETPNPLSPGFWKSLFKDMPSESILLLNMVAVLWGTQHAVIKMVVEDSDAGPFTLLRFGLAALVASPYTPGLPKFEFGEKQNDNVGVEDSLSLTSTADDENKQTSTSVATTWRWGAEMGFWMFLGFAFQAVGLGSTTAQRSGFLLYLNVKFVPFLARILLGREISVPTWISAFTAFTGTALLAYGSGSGGNGAGIHSLDLNAGDWWSIAAAAASAMFILRLERASSEVSDAAQLNAAQLWVVTLLAAVWTVGGQVVDGGGGLDSFADFHPWADVTNIIYQHPWEMIYLSGVTTAFANWIQAKAQRDVSAERASVIYAMDPVYGAAFSYLLLGETLGGVPGWAGAGLITVAAATNAFMDLSGSDNTQDKDPPEQEPEEGTLR